MPTVPHEVFTSAQRTPAPSSKIRRANGLTVVLAIGFVLASAAAVHFYIESRGALVRTGFLPRLSTDEASARALGWLVSENYASDMLIGIEITCRRSNTACLTAKAVIRDGRMDIFQGELEIAQWTDTRIVAVDNLPVCHRDFWILDLVADSTRLESVYKLPHEQVGNCSGEKTDTMKAHLGEFAEALRAMGAASR